MSFSFKARKNLRSMIATYLLGILFFGLFRLTIFLLNYNEVEHIQHDRWMLVFKAFIMGIRFDTVISCYILALPLLVFSVLFPLKKLTPAVLRAGYFYIGTLFTVALFICAVDVPFFNHFFNRLNDTIFNWTGHSSFGFKMVLQDKGFMAFFGLFLVVAATYMYLLRRLRKKHEVYLPHRNDETHRRQYFVYAPAVLLLLGFTFLGIRGRTEEKSPIVPGTAFFSNNPFINQLGLNPVFTLLRSWLDSQNPDNKNIHWIDDNEAHQTMAALFGAQQPLNNISPIARMEQTNPVFKGKNVVLVMMESMSAAKMKRFGNTDNLTPFLDSLATQCWSFDSVFSGGIHTYNGIYTSMFAHPALMKKHTMEAVTVPHMAGFPNTLKKAGYQTIYFTTHDEMFDNMSGFMSGNDVETVVGQKDYPASEVKSTLGVPDEFMFRFAVPKLSKLAANNKPFFAAFMTASDHDPLIIPTDHGFVPRNKEDHKQSTEYADWSLRKFIEYASAQPWFNNTVFVFVADHGAVMGKNAYDLPFSYQHIPFLIFAPGATSPRIINTLGLQADVFATVTSQVTGNFVNNTFGINLLADKRPYIVFSADDKLACMNDSLIYIYREGADPSLYKYRNSDLKDYISQYPQQADTMKKIAFAWLQTSQWMIQNNKADVK